MVLLAGVATVAQAGETVLYADAPEWVATSDFAAARAKNETLVLLDQQVRMDGGTVSSFSDVAYKIDSPEALTKSGTLSLGWMPDKGDLTVHRVEIWRGDERVDVIAGGTNYTVLRRERALERRSLDGSLTATLALPGLRVGDVVRFSQTVTSRDQVLGDAMQYTVPLLALPVKAGLARVLVSWPSSSPLKWQSGPDVQLPPPVTANGYTTLTATLPLPKAADLPQNAPARFTRTPQLEVASFAGWQDVSGRMAPHYATGGAISAGSPLAAKVAAITSATSDPLARAAAALQIVQDDIAYMLNGMNGGNYMPQAPVDTWTNRFGDCKAKTLLLLSMLREMGIESEAVLVRSQGGDAVASALPSAAAFDHVIVRAVIGGRDYWLDGTDRGIRRDTMEEVPPFFYGLPIRDGGADLMPVAQRWPEALDRLVTVTYDYRPGIDMPVAYDARAEMRGRMGAGVREKAELTDPMARLEYAEELMKNLVGDGIVYETTILYDDVTGVGTVRAKGLLGSAFEFERGRGTLSIGLPSTGIEFAPDRARTAWQAVPYAVGGPFGSAFDVTVLLPEASQDMELAGQATYEGEAAGTKVRRTSSLTGNRLHIVDQAVRIPGEIAVVDFGKERANAARLKAGAPLLRTSATPQRYWMLDPATARKRVAALEPIYAAIIAIEPTDAWRWTNRAALYQMGPDLSRALADYNKAIELEPSAENYGQRRNLRREMGDRAGSLADARAAFELETTLDYATSLADVLAEQGKTDEALAVLDSLDLSGDDRIKLMTSRADVLGEGGRVAEGWDLLEQAASERPGDAEVLNSQCWYMGNWSHELERAVDICDQAVKAGSYGADVLDSRALVHFRRQDRAAALSDLNAALIAGPNLTTSLYLRGLIAMDEGRKADGERDLAAAKRLYAGVEAYFARFGITRTGG